MKDISIIIPIYNCEEYLEECLNSVVCQTYPKEKIDVVMINDGTKDNSAKICEKYAKKYNFNFIDRKVNKGLSYTRNEGIKISSGKYIMFLDSDDVLASNAIQILLNNIRENDADMVISKLNAFNSKGEYGYYSDKYLKKEYVGSLLGNKKLINCISVCAKVYKRSLINKLYFLEGKYHEDNYFSLLAFLKSDKISVVSSYTYYRRIREGDNKSIMQNLNFKTFSDLLENFKYVLKDKICMNEYYFIFNFMLRKSINYLVMNIKKEEIKECKKMYDTFFENLCLIKNISGFNKIILKIKYQIYCLIARAYKKISLLV